MSLFIIQDYDTIIKIRTMTQNILFILSKLYISSDNNSTTKVNGRTDKQKRKNLIIITPKEITFRLDLITVSLLSRKNKYQQYYLGIVCSGLCAIFISICSNPKQKQILGPLTVSTLLFCYCQSVTIRTQIICDDKSLFSLCL